MTEQTATPEMKLTGDIGLLPWWLLLLWGILSLIVGIMFLTTPAITTVIFITFLGAFWFVGGLFTLFSLAVDRTNMGWKIFLAVLNIIAGLVILFYPLYSTLFLLSFLIIFLGIWACIMGCAHLYHAFTAKDAGTGALGILSLILGILLLAFPLISAALVPVVAGAFAFVLGICAIVFSFAAKNAQAAPVT
jgi:uncharacterized membrane protein HdeD (DUF308 family)